MVSAALRHGVTTETRSARDARAVALGTGARRGAISTAFDKIGEELVGLVVGHDPCGGSAQT